MVFRHPSAELCTTRWMNFTPAAPASTRGRRISPGCVTSTDGPPRRDTLASLNEGLGVARGNSVTSAAAGDDSRPRCST